MIDFLYYRETSEEASDYLNNHNINDHYEVEVHLMENMENGHEEEMNIH